MRGVSGKDRLKLERAVILRQMDRNDEADELIEGIADDTQIGTYLTVSQIYTLLEEHETALAWRRRGAAAPGPRAAAATGLDLPRPRAARLGPVRPRLAEACQRSFDARLDMARSTSSPAARRRSEVS